MLNTASQVRVAEPSMFSTLDGLADMVTNGLGSEGGVVNEEDKQNKRKKSESNSHLTH